MIMLIPPFIYAAMVNKSAPRANLLIHRVILGIKRSIMKCDEHLEEITSFHEKGQEEERREEGGEEEENKEDSIAGEAKAKDVFGAKGPLIISRRKAFQKTKSKLRNSADILKALRDMITSDEIKVNRQTILGISANLTSVFTVFGFFAYISAFALRNLNQLMAEGYRYDSSGFLVNGTVLYAAIKNSTNMTSG